MIIWIDGTYGIGKTQVALKVYEKLRDNKIELLNSDQYYCEIIKKLPYLVEEQCHKIIRCF